MMTLCHFGHILCPSRVISFLLGIFPCLGLKKSLKTANFAFLVICAIKGHVVGGDFSVV